MSDDFKDSSDRKGQIEVKTMYSEPFESVDSSATSWNDFISGLGLRFQHYAYSPYVIGSVETGSLRNYDDQKVQKHDKKVLYDNNGIYRYMGDVLVIWQSNQKSLTQLPAGYYPNSTATVTVNRCYKGTKEIVGLSEFDKLIPVIEGDPLEYASVNWEEYTHNPTGIDRLMFRMVKVDSLSDANGVDYTEGLDFIIEDGHIKWTQGGSRPGLDNASHTGMVMSIRYRYVPSFYIKYAAHELRSHATINPNTYEKKPVRGPMSAALQIDWVFLQSLKNQNDNGDSSRNAGTGGNTGPK
jgi:hypothetical protein